MMREREAKPKSFLPVQICSVRDTGTTRKAKGGVKGLKKAASRRSSKPQASVLGKGLGYSKNAKESSKK